MKIELPITSVGTGCRPQGWPDNPNRERPGTMLRGHCNSAYLMQFCRYLWHAPSQVQRESANFCFWLIGDVPLGDYEGPLGPQDRALKFACLQFSGPMPATHQEAAVNDDL